MEHHRSNAENYLREHAHDIPTFPLGGEDAVGLVTKSALLPFRRLPDGPEICLMQPVSSKKELGAAKYEICKGTRMWLLPEGKWMDLKKEPFPTEGEPEALILTALREAGEEMNLPLKDIQHLANCGIQPFTSASTGVDKQMQLFLAEMRPETEIDAPDAKISGTERVEWFPLRAALEDARIRSDHRRILGVLALRLAG